QLPFVYDGSAETRAVPFADQLRGELSQRIIVTAAKVAETAGTVFAPNSDRRHGFLSWCMISWISQHPDANAANVVQRLRHIGETRPERIQRPRIVSR
ncbi:hypothetical protein FRB90_001470, partial [Tulasnella sp. 427]